MNGPDLEPISIDRARPVRPGEELDAGALHEFLRENLPEYAGPPQIEQFPSGHSNLTYLIRDGENEWALRRPPHGAAVKRGHDMGREWAILKGLEKTWDKAPKPLAFCDDEAVIGAPFYIMERVRGVILRGASPKGLKATEPLMRGLSETLADVLAEIHGLDYEAAGLSGLARPEGYVERQVTGWIGRYEKARTDDVGDMEKAARWLEGSRPGERDAAFIHNDFKYDNLALDPSDLTRVVAVLDWEMATVGDPFMDLGTALGYWVDADDPPGMHMLGLLPTALPGNLNRKALVERYVEKSGRECPDPVFYYVFGLYKVAVIAQQIYARYKKGFTKDERFARLIGAVYLLSSQAVRAIEAGRIDRLG